jgi:hypothetical protein
MSVPQWPTDLPRPNRQGYSAQNRDPRLRKNADAGPSGYHRRYSSVARTVGLSFDLSRSEKAVFDKFHNVTTGFGHKPFLMPDPTTDGWPLLDSTGAPVLTTDMQPLLISAQWLCLFGDNPPSETIRGLEFVISFSVEVMP